MLALLKHKKPRLNRLIILSIVVLSTNLTPTLSSAVPIQNWVRQSTPGNDVNYWTAIAASDDGTKMVAADAGNSSGSIFTSTDSGATWTRRTSAGLGEWVAVTSSSDGSKLAAIPSYGSVYTSNDYGATWEAQNGSSPTGPREWSSITSSDDGTMLAATST